MDEERKRLLEGILEESKKMVVNRTWPITDDEVYECRAIRGSFEFGFLCGHLNCKENVVEKVCGWIDRNAHNYIVTRSVHGTKVTGLDGSITDDLRKAMSKIV